MRIYINFQILLLVKVGWKIKGPCLSISWTGVEGHIAKKLKEASGLWLFQGTVISNIYQADNLLLK